MYKMKSINKVTLIGCVGGDPEVRYMPDGRAVANFSIATNEEWKDQSGQKQSKATWHKCVAFAKLGEIIGEYVKKGAKLYVEGKISNRQYQDNTGQTRYAFEIILSHILFLGDSSPNSASSSQNSANNNQNSTQYDNSIQPIDNEIPF